MTDAEVEQIVAALAAGASYRVPFSTKLFPDTTADETHVRRQGDGIYEVVTTFREFAPGHGWSLAQTEHESWPEEQLRSALKYSELAKCSRDPR